MTYKLTNTSLNPDPYYGAVSLLLSGDGANNSTDIRDSSLNTKAITVAGDAKISTAQSKWNGSSLAFDGSGDYLTTPYLTSAFDWWTTDFTIEMWVYASSWANWSFASLGPVTRAVGNFDPSSATNYWSFGPDIAGRPRLYYYNGSEQHGIYTTNVLATSQWHHIAASKNSSGVRLFINGVNNDGVFSINGTPQSSAAVPFTIGQYNGIGITGYIDDLRITKGVARYTSNFTPPTQPFPNF